MLRRRSTTWMWAEACQALARTERLRQQFFEVTAEPGDAGPAWEAPVDVFEHRGTLVVWIALRMSPPAGGNTPIQSSTSAGFFRSASGFIRFRLYRLIGIPFSAVCTVMFWALLISRFSSRYGFPSGCAA